jgi:ABC-type transporter Mla subunit MlaD
VSSSAAKNISVATAPDTDDDLGLFDIVENLQTHAESAGQFLHALAAELSAMTEVMNSVTNDFETIRNVRPLEPGETKPGIQKVANAMNKLSQLLEGELPSYAENLLAMGNDAREMVRVSYDWIGSDEDMLTHLWSFRGTLSTVSAIIGENRSSLEAMLDQTSRLQRTTANFNKAKRRLMQNATGLLEVNDGGRSIIGVAIDELGRLIVAVEQHQRQRDSDN